MGGVVFIPMTNAFEGLKPAPLWNYFDEICQIPRPSKKEEKMIVYLEEFSKKHGLAFRKDKVNNIVISKAATPGLENRKKVVLQSHVDMVCEKNKETVHDFNKDPIKAYVEGDWIKAEGTTLGADNGIGVAAAMAVLTTKDLVHGPLECLFTVDEETGLTGAHALEPGFITGEILINLDTEDDGVFTIGCAGGMDTVLTLTPTYENLPAGYEVFSIEVKGLNGGHSGVDINKGLGNALKILAPLLLEVLPQDLRVLNIQGGNLRNAIPRETSAIVALPAANVTTLKSKLESYLEKVKLQYQKTETGLNIVCEKSTDASTKCFGKEFTQDLLVGLVECPHGVLKMSADIPGLVETSTNLASIKMDGAKIVIATSQRSSVVKDKGETSTKVINAFKKTNAVVEVLDKYPGWTPNVKSEVLDLFKTTYKKLFQKDPVIEVIHAGLECGLIGEKEPHLDMISIGPTIKGPHSPAEKLQISTVEKFWDLLVLALKDIPVKS